MNFLFNINVCRVCMQNERSIDLCSDKDLLEKFIFTTRLVISEKDNLPKVICANCTARLKIAHKFIKTAHESENNLKNFLAKINIEFKEVTQANKDNNKQLNEKNLTEDEILSLVEDEDETPTTQTNFNLKDDKKTENKNVKRKLSPTIEQVQKKSKTNLENVSSKPTTEIRKSKDVLQIEELQIIKKEETVYHLSEDILLIHDTDNNETEYENDTNPNENDDTDQQEHAEEEEHANEMEEGEEEIHEELDSRQTDINTLEVLEESQTRSQLTELTQDNPEENANEIQSVENDGYLREYESILINNQVDNLQYQPEFVDENSVEEVTLKDNTFYIQNLEQDEDHDDVDGDGDGDDEDDEQPETITINELEELPSKSFAKKEMRRFYCEQCQRDFSTKTNLNRHMQSHEGNKPFPCTECDKSFTQKSSLKQHMYTHTGEKPYVCEVCNRGFTQCKSLIFHMRRHTGEKPFQCEYCLITFRQKDALRIHILKHHVMYEQTADGTEIFTCIICQKKFNTNSKFKTHMKSHTANADIDTVEFLRDDDLGDGGLSLRRARNQKSEIALQLSLDSECLDANVVNVAASSAADASRAKKFQCGKCFKCFALKKSLVRHMRIHSYDPDDGLSECVECDLQFSKPEDYQEHMMERHHYNCSGCPELTFKTIQDLKLHMFEHELEQQEEQE